MKEALEAADKKLLVDHHDDTCQQQLQQSHGNVIIVEKCREGKPEHHVSHGKIHEHK